jgi:hypothetical protein
MVVPAVALVVFLVPQTSVLLVAGAAAHVKLTGGLYLFLQDKFIYTL